MHIRLSIIAHYIVMLISALFVLNPLISASIAGEEYPFDHFFAFMQGAWFIPLILIPLIIALDLISSKMLKSEKSLLLRSKSLLGECDAFHKFINSSIRNGMLIKECEGILETRNNERAAESGKDIDRIKAYSLMLSESPLYYDKFNESYVGIGVATFYIDWFTQKITLRMRFWRRTAVVLQTALLLALFGSFCPILELALIDSSGMDFLAMIIMGAGFIGIAFYSWLTFGRDFFNNIEHTEKESFTYCKNCRRIVFPESFRSTCISRTAPDFSASTTTSNTTYREARVASITTRFGDGSEYTAGIYADVANTTTLTAYGSTHYKKYCPHCNEEYYDIETTAQSITVRH